MSDESIQERTFRVYDDLLLNHQSEEETAFSHQITLPADLDFADGSIGLRECDVEETGTSHFESLLAETVSLPSCIRCNKPVLQEITPQRAARSAGRRIFANTQSRGKRPTMNASRARFGFLCKDKHLWSFEPVQGLLPHVEAELNAADILQPLERHEQKRNATGDNFHRQPRFCNCPRFNRQHPCHHFRIGETCTEDRQRLSHLHVCRRIFLPFDSNGNGANALFESQYRWPLAFGYGSSSEDKCRTNRWMPCHRQFHGRSEDTDTVVVMRIVWRKHEGSFRKVHLFGDHLHERGSYPFGFGKHRKLIATKCLLGKDID